ncbi:hypothetical protein L1278_000849 [Pontibacter sp. HSC-36F09]|nr:hypothetical protein [Pontibacter sp. HSC-36F09]
MILNLLYVESNIHSKKIYNYGYTINNFKNE